MTDLTFHPRIKYTVLRRDPLVGDHTDGIVIKEVNGMRQET